MICAHTVRPGITKYRCTCRPCWRLSQRILLTLARAPRLLPRPCIFSGGVLRRRSLASQKRFDVLT